MSPSLNMISNASKAFGHASKVFSNASKAFNLKHLVKLVRAFSHASKAFSHASLAVFNKRSVKGRVRDDIRHLLRGLQIAILENNNPEDRPLQVDDLTQM